MVVIELIVNYEIEDQQITKKEFKYLVNKTKNYLQLNFKFNKTWNDYTNKFIIFKYLDKNYEKLLEYDGEAEAYTCLVPAEVLKGKGFRFLVYGSIFDGETETRITTEYVNVRLRESGFVTKVDPIDEHYSEDIFTQILHKLGLKFDELVIEDDIIHCRSEGVTLQTISLDDFLAGKADVDHTHTVSDITDFNGNVGFEIKASFRQLANRIRTGDE